MSTYTWAMKAGTLFFGVLLSWLAVGPLAAFAYFLIWLDTIVIYMTPGLKNGGIDLTTLVAILFGIALGPVLGFIFTLVVLPLLIIGLLGVVYEYVDEFVISVEFLFLAVASLFAGLVAPFLPLFVAVLVSLLFRYFSTAFLEKQMYGGTTFSMKLLNLFFTFVVINGMNSLGVFAGLGGIA